MRQTEDGIEIREINITKFRERVVAIRSIYAEVGADLTGLEVWAEHKPADGFEAGHLQEKIIESTEAFALSSCTFESRMRELTNLVGQCMPYPGIGRLRRP